MFVYHFRLRKGLTAAAAAAFTLLLALLLVLPGCQKQDAAPIPAGTDADRLAYLTGLGWTVEETPVETLDLLLPEKLKEETSAR